MPLNKVFENVRSRVAQFVGANDEIKWEIDTSPSPSELVVTDTVNSTELYRLPLNTQLETTLESGNTNEISSGSLTNQNPTAHASEHSSGGVDEIDAADLGGGSGTSGQILETDGSSASWSNANSLGASDFDTENGEFTGSGNSSITFSNTYDPNTVSHNISSKVVYNGDSNTGDVTMGALFESYNTDGNGDVTGMEIDVSDSDVGNTTVSWEITGVPV